MTKRLAMTFEQAKRFWSAVKDYKDAKRDSHGMLLPGENRTVNALTEVANDITNELVDARDREEQDGDNHDDA